jgi:hypothetical protein
MSASPLSLKVMWNAQRSARAFIKPNSTIIETGYTTWIKHITYVLLEVINTSRTTIDRGLNLFITYRTQSVGWKKETRTKQQPKQVSGDFSVLQNWTLEDFWAVREIVPVCDTVTQRHGGTRNNGWCPTNWGVSAQWSNLFIPPLPTFIIVYVAPHFFTTWTLLLLLYASPIFCL